MIAVETTLTVRALTVEELPLCVPLGQAFHQEWQQDGTFAPESFLRHWRYFLAAFPCAILGLWQGEALIGGISVMLAPDINTGRAMANEFFLYVDPAHRHGTGLLRLLRSFKAWGRERGAVKWRLEHLLGPDETPHDIQLARVYQKLGYKPVNVGFELIEEGL